MKTQLLEIVDQLAKLRTPGQDTQLLCDVNQRNDGIKNSRWEELTCPYCL